MDDGCAIRVQRKQRRWSAVQLLQGLSAPSVSNRQKAVVFLYVTHLRFDSIAAYGNLYLEMPRMQATN